MKKKSVWLHNPTGNPKKTLFTVTKTEISLGDTVLQSNEVAAFKRTYAKPFYGKINPAFFWATLGKYWATFYYNIWSHGFKYKTNPFLVRSKFYNNSKALTVDCLAKAMN